MPRRSLTQPIPEEDQPKRNWRVYLDGNVLPRVTSVVIDHPRLGTLTYGQAPQGYDGWTFREEGGGGSVILPYASLDGVLHVGVVLQRRPNQGGEVWNAPRGFLDPGEGRRLGALRELAEEVGLRAELAGVIALSGEPANPNSAFFETWLSGEGVSFFAVEVPRDLLTRSDGAWSFLPDAIEQSAEARRSRATEAIYQARFIPWWQATRLGDLFTIAGVARLLADLHAERSSELPLGQADMEPPPPPRAEPLKHG